MNSIRLFWASIFSSFSTWRSLNRTFSSTNTEHLKTINTILTYHIRNLKFTFAEALQIFFLHLWLLDLYLTWWYFSRSKHFEGISTDFQFLIQSFSSQFCQDYCDENQQKILASQNQFPISPSKCLPIVLRT